MTKEIIIDGVNILGCKHYDLENNYCDQSYLGEGGLLKNTKNPKRCEQSPNCYFKQLQRLKQENEELKYEIDRQKDTILYLQNYDICHKTLIEYKQALEEIKSLAELEVILDVNSRAFYPANIQRILDKINEVLNEK